MRKIIIKSIVSLGLLGLVTASFADNDPAQTGGFYVGASVGAAFTQSDDHDPIFEDYSAGTHFLGPVVRGAIGYQFGSYFAMELNGSYTDPRQGTSSLLIADYKRIFAVNLMLRGILPLKDGVGLFAEIGFGTKIFQSTDQDGEVRESNSDMFRIPIGLGVSYELSPKLNFIALFQYESSSGYITTPSLPGEELPTDESLGTFSLGFNYYL